MSLNKNELIPIIKNVMSKALARFIIDECPETTISATIPYHSKLNELYDRVCSINRMKAKRGHYIWEDIDEPAFIGTAYQIAIELINPNHIIIIDNTER